MSAPDLLSILRPQVVIRYPIDPNTPLPCHGKWYFFDADVVTERHRELCATCPVQEWCLKSALLNDEHGIWAGTDREQRRQLMQWKGR